MAIRPDEISAILKEQIQSFEADIEVDNVGTVIMVGDGTFQSVQTLDQLKTQGE